MKYAMLGQSDLTNSTALYFHGGNFVLGNKDMLSPDYVDELLGLGFGAVVSPNYRLGPTVSLLNGPVGDARDSYLWSQTELPTRLAEDSNVKLDGKRIVAIGHSAGGTLALLLVRYPSIIYDLPLNITKIGVATTKAPRYSRSFWHEVPQG